MNKKVRWITETAVMLALLVALQALTKGFGQFVTGSCVNAVLAVTVLTAGLGSGIVVAVLSRCSPTCWASRRRSLFFPPSWPATPWLWSCCG